MQDQRWLPDHAAEAGGLFDRRNVLLESTAMHAAFTISVGVAAGRRYPKARFAAHGVTAFAVRPTTSEHLLEPQAHQRRRAVPIDGVLPDDQFSLEQQGLFCSDVDREVWIPLVE